LKTLFSISILLLVLVASGSEARAQDPFEIQVYEYETVPKGMWNLETHINYIGKGTRKFEGPVAPTNDQFHLTFELTRGVTETFEMAGYLVLAHRPGGDTLDYVAWRLRPRVSVPRSWHWPVDVSMSVEFGFPRKVYEENSVTLELRPIIEKKLGRFQIDVNPVVGRALRGPGTNEGWDFEPGVRFAYEMNKKLDLSLEYYGSTGAIGDFLPSNEQVHQLFPGGDLKLSEKVVWNFGIGVGMTDAGNRLVYKTRVGILFGKGK
jgi:hypothetical protein